MARPRLRPGNGPLKKGDDMDEKGDGLHIEASGLRLGLSTMLRYAYGGLLLVLLATIFKSGFVKTMIEAMTAPVALAVTVAVGAAIYVFHRNLIIPLHHLGLCLILNIFGKDLSPTAYFKEMGVERGKRILAYNVLRRSEFYKDRVARDIAHAENGLLILSAEGLLGASAYSFFSSNLDWTVFAILGGILLIASYGPAIRNHTFECRIIKNRKEEVRQLLNEFGLLQK